MPGSSSWMPYAPQGVKGFEDDDKIFPCVLTHNVALLICFQLQRNAHLTSTKISRCVSHI